MRWGQWSIPGMILVLFLSESSASEASPTALSGQWQVRKKIGEREFEITLEFLKEGKQNLRVTVGKETVRGRFEVKGEELTLILDNRGVERKRNLRFKLEGDKLLITEKDRTTTFTRVKPKQ